MVCESHRNAVPELFDGKLVAFIEDDGPILLEFQSIRVHLSECLHEARLTMKIHGESAVLDSC
jgi:hypothetical protein